MIPTIASKVTKAEDGWLEHTLYWLAGLLEGEGCFSIVRHRYAGGAKLLRRSPQLTITLNMSDRDVVERVAGLWHTSVRAGSRSPLSVKNTFQTRVSGHAAHAWMMTLWPLMGERRQARILEVLRAYTLA